MMNARERRLRTTRKGRREAERELLRTALAAYRSALRSGEPESWWLRRLGNAALGLEEKA